MESKQFTKNQKYNPSSEAVETVPQEEQNNTIKRFRLRRSLEKQSKKTLVLAGLGLVSLIGLLVLFGQALLINFSIFLDQAKNGQTGNTPTQAENVLYIAPPILDPQRDATNSASIKISGIASSDTGLQIRLYVNDELIDVTTPDVSDVFIFDDIILKEGKNIIKAVSTVKNKTSDDSNLITISYLKDAPALTIDDPQDGASYSGENSTISVLGKTSQGASVSVNDYTAITKSNGIFSYNLKLQTGENKIKVVAKDQAENKTEKEIKVIYSP